MKSTVLLTFVVKEYLGGMISRLCYLAFSGHAYNLYDEHKLNAEILCLNILWSSYISIGIGIYSQYIGYRNIG